MTDAEKKAYSRGYFRGSQGAWPDHRPPTPPNGPALSMVRALKELRDAADTICASLDENDEWVQVLGPAIDNADAALKGLGVWLRTTEGSRSHE